MADIIEFSPSDNVVAEDQVEETYSTVMDVIEEAKESGVVIEEGLLIGADQEGKLVMISNLTHASEIIMMLEQVKLSLLSQG